MKQCTIIKQEAISVKLRPVFEHLRQIKLHKKQQFSESLENLTGALETRSLTKILWLEIQTFKSVK